MQFLAVVAGVGEALDHRLSAVFVKPFEMQVSTWDANLPLSLHTFCPCAFPIFQKQQHQAMIRIDLL